MRLGSAWIAAAVVVMWWSALGHAQSRSFALRWTGEFETAGCIDADDVTRGLRDRLGPDALADQEHAARVVEVNVEKTTSGVKLKLTLRDAAGDAQGERELVAADDDCTTLRDAAVLAIAVMAGPEAAVAANVDQTPVSASATSTPPPTAVSAARANAKPRQLSDDEDPRHSSQTNLQSGSARRLEVFAGSAFTDGIVPDPALHAALFLRYSVAQHLAFELSLVFLGQASAAMSGPFTGGARFTPYYGTLALCPLNWETSAGRVGACMGVQAGVLTARHSSTASSGSSVEPLAGVLVRVPCSLRLVGPLKLSAAISAGTPLVYRTVDVIDPALDIRKVWRTAPVFASVELGLGLELF